MPSCAGQSFGLVRNCELVLWLNGVDRAMPTAINPDKRCGLRVIFDPIAGPTTCWRPFRTVFVALYPPRAIRVSPPIRVGCGTRRRERLSGLGTQGNDGRKQGSNLVAAERFELGGRWAIGQCSCNRHRKKSDQDSPL